MSVGHPSHKLPLQAAFSREPPNVGSAPTGLWKVPPIPPFQLEDPSLKPQPFLPTPFFFLQCSRKGRPRLVWGGVMGCKGAEGEGPPSSTWATPSSGGTRYSFVRTWAALIETVSPESFPQQNKQTTFRTRSVFSPDRDCKLGSER